MKGLQRLGVVAFLGLTSCGFLPIGWVVSETYVSQPIQVPEGARVGQSVEIRFAGWGPDTCYSADSGKVQVDDAAQVVRLRAYVKKVITAGGGACGAAFVKLPMSATFRPQRAGTYRIEALTGAGPEPETIAEVQVTE